MLLEHERNYGFGMDALVTVCCSNTNGILVLAWMLWLAHAARTRTELWFWHGCSGNRMLLEHERNYGFGMDALVTVCCSNTNGIRVLAWMLWLPYAARTRTELWFWHGCSGNRMLLEHERNYGFGIDARYFTHAGMLPGQKTLRIWALNGLWQPRKCRKPHACQQN